MSFSKVKFITELFNGGNKEWGSPPDFMLTKL